MSTRTNRWWIGCTLALAWLGLAASAGAAPINYGDFLGASVLYLDVTETALTPGDDEPLFGPPAIETDTLDFDDLRFAAVAPSGQSDLTDGKLQFTLLSDTAIATLAVREGGDYSVAGTGGEGATATRVRYVLTIAAEVVEVDGVALAVSVPLDGVVASGSKHLTVHPDDGFWGLGALYDVNAALIAAGIEFEGGATRLDVVIDNRLEAVSSAPDRTAFIAKKDFRITAEVGRVPAPEPGTAALLGLGLLALGSRRRARGARLLGS